MKRPDEVHHGVGSNPSQGLLGIHIDLGGEGSSHKLRGLTHRWSWTQNRNFPDHVRLWLNLVEPVMARSSRRTPCPSGAIYIHIDLGGEGSSHKLRGLTHRWSWTQNRNISDHIRLWLSLCPPASCWTLCGMSSIWGQSQHFQGKEELLIGGFL